MPAHGSGDFTREYAPASGAVAIRREVFFSGKTQGRQS